MELSAKSTYLIGAVAAEPPRFAQAQVQPHAVGQQTAQLNPQLIAEEKLEGKLLEKKACCGGLARVFEP